MGATPPQTTAAPPPSGGIAPHEGPTRRRHATSRLHVVQTPHHYQHGERRGHGEPSRTAHERQKPGNWPQGRPHLRDKTRPALAQHESHSPTSGTKLSLLAQNGPIWRNLRMQGEFCTALVSTTLSRENFVPNTRQKSNQPTQQHTRHRQHEARQRNHRACPRCKRTVGRATASHISHAIPPRHEPTQAQKPQNIND